RYMFLRDVSTVEVKHRDGSVETISVPEDAGTKMFQNDTHFPFMPRQSVTLDSVWAGFPAEKAGLLKTDKIVSINGKEITYLDEFETIAKANKDKENILVINRENQLDTLKVTPNEKGTFGITFSREELISQIGQTEITYSLGQSIVGGFGYGYNTLKDYVSQFKYVFTKKGATQVGGFGAIGSLF